MKMYHEGGRELTEDLEDQIAFGDGGFHVERLSGVRYVNGQPQVVVKWLGFEEEEESSWEPARNMLEDIPVVLQNSGTRPSSLGIWLYERLSYLKSNDFNT